MRLTGSLLAEIKRSDIQVLWIVETKCFIHTEYLSALDSKKLSVNRQLLISQTLTHQRQIKGQQ